MKWIARLVGLMVMTQTAAPASLLPDPDIKRIIADRIDVQQQGVGIVVGVIEPVGRRVVTQGRAW